VLATQNPVEQEGTYPCLKRSRPVHDESVRDYLDKGQELESCAGWQTSIQRRCAHRTRQGDIFAIRDEINRVSISETLENISLNWFATRRPLDYGLKEEAAYISWRFAGASTHSNRAAKAMAFLHGRDYVLPEDIKEVAHDVMNHRLLLTTKRRPTASPSQIVEMILKVAIGSKCSSGKMFWIEEGRETLFFCITI
jgi:MoxR-like ATPase